MPGDDRFSRYLTPTWKRALRSLQGREPAERVADNLTAAALAATMRTVHGVPMLPQIAQRMQEAAIHGTRFETIARPDTRHVPTELAEQAAAALAVTMQRELALVSPAQAALILARKVVAELAYHYGFDRMPHKLLGDKIRRKRSSRALRRGTVRRSGRQAHDPLPGTPHWRRAAGTGPEAATAGGSGIAQRGPGCLVMSASEEGLVEEFPPVLDTSALAPADVVRLDRAYVREWEAAGPEFGLRRHDGAAAL